LKRYGSGQRATPRALPRQPKAAARGSFRRETTMSRSTAALAAPLLAVLAFGAPQPAAAQDAEAGRRVYNQCRACHTIDAGGRNGVGPNLHGVVGRKAGAIDGFRYSADMKAKADGGLTWNEETLRAYIANPKAVVPAGSMSYPGLKNEQQMNDLLAFMKANG
jgi:cytochrome c